MWDQALYRVSSQIDVWKKVTRSWLPVCAQMLACFCKNTDSLISSLSRSILWTST